MTATATATVWIVAGPPGSGKSTVARLLAARLDPPGAVLDKDTVYAGFVDAALDAAGRPRGEREGDWYDAHVKPHEYAGLAATARDVRSSGCPPVVVAPFTTALRSPDAWAGLAGACGGEPVRLVWIDVDPATLARRLRDRGSPRDAAKLADLDGFMARMRPGSPPAVPHITVPNRGTLDDLSDRIRRLGSWLTDR